MAKPSLFEANTYQEIRERVTTLTPAHSRVWGTMDVSQAMRHLRKAIKLAFGGAHTAKTPSLVQRIMAPMIKRVVMSEKPYKQNLPTAKGIKIGDPADFETEKTRLLEALDAFFNYGGDAASKNRHPLFGNLTADEWGYSQWKHFDHHLRQFKA